MMGQLCKKAVPALAGMAALGAPKFEVASVKACKDGEAIAEGGGQKGGRGGIGSSPPDRLNLPCVPVRFFIQMRTFFRIFDRDRIAAKAEVLAGTAMTKGPMLQALVEDVPLFDAVFTAPRRSGPPRHRQDWNQREV